MINELYEPKDKRNILQTAFDVEDALVTTFDHDETEVHSESDDSGTSEIDRLRRLLVADVCDSVVCWLLYIGKCLHKCEKIQ